MLSEKYSVQYRTPRKFRINVLKWLVIAIVAVFLTDFMIILIAEGLWFQEVQYLPFFAARLLSIGLLGGLTFGISVGFLWRHLAIARQTAHPPDISKPESTLLSSSSKSWRRYPGSMRFLPLMALTTVLCVGIGTMLLYHGRIAIEHWTMNLSVTDEQTRIPVRFSIDAVGQTLQTFGIKPWFWLGIAGLSGAIVFFPWIVLHGIAIFTSISLATISSEYWSRVLIAFTSQTFQKADPLFGNNISFYVFRLPLLELLGSVALGITTLALVTNVLIYLLSGNSLSNGRFPGFSLPQQRNLCHLLGLWMGAIAWSYWLKRYQLLFQSDGVTFGAGYTDVYVRLPMYTLFAWGGLALAILFLLYGWLTSEKKRTPLRRTHIVRPLSSKLTSWHLILITFGGFWALVLGTAVLPYSVQRLVVQPNELTLERPFLERTIAFTRNAFKLDAIDTEPFVPQSNLTYQSLLDNDLTVKNIRLWDTRPLLETNRQLQQFRPYYRFPEADIDRYTLIQDDGTTEQQQVLIAARELDYSAVPTDAQTWVNEHLIYTHGYGFTVSPVNRAATGGLPDYLIKDIGPNPADEVVARSIPIGEPRLYYGELSNTYVMVKTTQPELDFPSGSDNVYNTYSGSGGIQIGSFWRRIVFARYLRDWKMMLTDTFTPDTRVLFRRTIQDRIRTIAPFLRYDHDPYLVVADTGHNAADQNYLYWVLDAYTTSDRYPYSDPLASDFNYIRNSIKVVLDAYNGSVTFYIADDSDPVINAWSELFPGAFKPLSEMPPALRSHIRYPQDFFQVQSQQLMIYHMTDPQVFYNREDQWRAPNEIYGSEQQEVEPYYLIMKLPTEKSEEFILLRPFTPSQRNNMIAWLAARSDSVITGSGGELRYGRMLLYRFPKETLVFGPEQIEARINQDPRISEQISLWNRQGSRAIQGNLLVIPIEQSLLYVEPLYLEAEQNRLPTLARVIVVYENRIVMAETLEKSLRAIFQPDEGSPPIIRTVEESIPPPDLTLPEPNGGVSPDIAPDAEPVE
ncbi:MAG: UPF0182 family protein [Synechococcales cyanobacterium T60_A2020_003]|nr:UPF0182 family protein [Synechococcales cyanobacterium T60_A2020_003]